jgi:hypothetical protein
MSREVDADVEICSHSFFFEYYRDLFAPALNIKPVVFLFRAGVRHMLLQLLLQSSITITIKLDRLA